MSETTVPKRRRLKPEPTPGGAAGGSAGATTETVRMPHKEATRLAKDCLKVAQIRYLCRDPMTNPGATLAAIAGVLDTATTSDSEDETPGTRRTTPPAEDVVGLDQQ
jgi:hypothetical protein